MPAAELIEQASGAAAGRSLGASTRRSSRCAAGQAATAAPAEPSSRRRRVGASGASACWSRASTNRLISREFTRSVRGGRSRRTRAGDLPCSDVSAIARSGGAGRRCGLDWSTGMRPSASGRQTHDRGLASTALGSTRLEAAAPAWCRAQAQRACISRACAAHDAPGPRPPPGGAADCRPPRPGRCRPPASTCGAAKRGQHAHQHAAVQGVLHRALPTSGCAVIEQQRVGDDHRRGRLHDRRRLQGPSSKANRAVCCHGAQQRLQWHRSRLRLLAALSMRDRSSRPSVGLATVWLVRSILGEVWWISMV